MSDTTGIDWGNVTNHAGTWIVGALIGVGQMLHRPPKDGERWVCKLIGQALVSGGLGASSGAVLLLIPNAPIIGVFGLSAAFATLGTTALERVFSAAVRGDNK